MSILDYTDGPLMKTGQTLEFTPAGRTTKDDGGFQRGIVGSKADGQYDVLTTGQYSGTTNITVNGKIDIHTNNCVFDKVTGLLWNREVSAAVFGAGDEDLLWADTTNNEDIFEFCDQANNAGLAGFTDWRIPNMEELSSLLRFNGDIPTINISAFPIWPTEAIWSSTSQRGTSDTFFFRVSFNNGSIDPTLLTIRFPVALCRIGTLSAV